MKLPKVFFKRSHSATDQKHIDQHCNATMSQRMICQVARIQFTSIVCIWLDATEKAWAGSPPSSWTHSMDPGTHRIIALDERGKRKERNEEALAPIWNPERMTSPSFMSFLLRRTQESPVDVDVGNASVTRHSNWGSTVKLHTSGTGPSIQLVIGITLRVIKCKLGLAKCSSSSSSKLSASTWLTKVHPVHLPLWIIQVGQVLLWTAEISTVVPSEDVFGSVLKIDIRDIKGEESETLGQWEHISRIVWENDGQMMDSIVIVYGQPLEDPKYQTSSYWMTKWLKNPPTYPKLSSVSLQMTWRGLYNCITEFSEFSVLWTLKTLKPQSIKPLHPEH